VILALERASPPGAPTQRWRVSLDILTLDILTLARLEAALDLVDHIDPALAPDQAVGTMATAQRFQRVTDLHGRILMLPKAVAIGRMWQNGDHPADGNRPGRAGF